MSAACHPISPAIATSVMTLAAEVFAQWGAGKVVVLDHNGITVDGKKWQSSGSAPDSNLASPVSQQPYLPTMILASNLSSVEQYHLAQRYHQISNNDLARRAEKWIGLKSLGLSDQDCEEACRPKEFDREQAMREVAELAAKERRALDRYNREQNPKHVKQAWLPNLKSTS